MNNVSVLHRPITFTIDGREHTTTDQKQPAGDLLRLAGLDPSRFDLGELKGHRPDPIRYRREYAVHRGLEQYRRDTVRSGVLFTSPRLAL